jgi:hypothetical protein
MNCRIESGTDTSKFPDLALARSGLRRPAIILNPYATFFGVADNGGTGPPSSFRRAPFHGGKDRQPQETFHD